MSTPVANINITTDIWLAVIQRVNQLAFEVSNECITANATTANTTGNAQLLGVFGANTLVATGGLRGGNVGSSAVLPITSNVVFSGATINSSANVNQVGTTSLQGSTTIGPNGSVTVLSQSGANLIIGGTNTAINANLTANGTATFQNTVTHNGQSNFNALVAIQGNAFIDLSANAGVGAGNVVVYRFPKATYTSAEIVVQAKNAGVVQTSKILIATDGGSNASIATYATIVPGGSGANTDPLGTYTANVNSANVELVFLQTVSNCAVKVLAHLVT